MPVIKNKNTGQVLARSNQEKQELWCHECNSYVQFPIDLTMNGNHVLNCPKCNHEHCRVVEDGRITDVRWDSRNGNTYQIAMYAVTATSTATATATSTISYSSYATNWGTSGTSTTVW
jgi:hypothetical protein